MKKVRRCLQEHPSLSEDEESMSTSSSSASSENETIITERLRPRQSKLNNPPSETGTNKDTKADSQKSKSLQQDNRR